MTAVVIGGFGFVGRHLIESLARLGHRVVAAGRGERGAPIRRDVEVRRCDVTDSRAVQCLMHEVKPELVVNLAAAVRGLPSAMIRVNTWGAVNVVASVRDEAPDARVIFFGSAAEYGAASRTCRRLNEGVECSPVDAYGMTKLAATQTALELSRKWGLRTVVLRPFNIVGPGAPEWSLLGASIRRLLDARRAGFDVVRVGRIDTYRDFVAVDDVVDAILRVAQSNLDPCVMNLCSGTPTKVSEVLAELGRVSGQAVNWQVDPDLVRPDDIESCVGDPGYARDSVGFSARVSLTEAIDGAWRHAVSETVLFGEHD